MGDLLAACPNRYNLSLPLEIQPSDNTLLIVAKMHDRRPGGLIPLSKVSAASCTRDLKIGPTRIMGPLAARPKYDERAFVIRFFWPRQNRSFAPSAC